MTNTLPKMHVCKNCGFMSMRGKLFEVVGDKLLCLSCVEATEAESGARSIIMERAVLQR